LRFVNELNCSSSISDKNVFVKKVVSAPARACVTAAAAAMRALGIVGDEVTVEVLGGVLRIEFDDEGHAWMTGPAEESFRGVFPLALVEPDRPAALS